MSLPYAAAPLRVALVTSSYNFIADGVALTLNRLVGYLLAQGVEGVGSTPEAFAVFLGSELKKWARGVRDAGIRPD